MAERFAEALRGGDLVVLSGDLGAGKTTFAQGVAAALGVNGPVTSPTFVLAKEYPLLGGGRLVHADAYRLTSFGELEELTEDLMGPDAITLVEWGDAVAEGLPSGRYTVSIAAADSGRRIEISGSTPDLEAHLERELGTEPG